MCRFQVADGTVMRVQFRVHCGWSRSPERLIPRKARNLGACHFFGPARKAQEQTCFGPISLGIIFLSPIFLTSLNKQLLMSVSVTQRKSLQEVGEATLSENEPIRCKEGDEMSLLIAIAILNALLGVSCGALFRVTILIPLIAMACVEIAILKMTGLWPSPILSAFTLIVLIDTGYLIGASMAALLPSSVRREMLRGFARRDFAGGGW
jgi:hypothetical protein